MLEELGPLINFRMLGASIPPTFFAAIFWSIGHMLKLNLSGKEFDLPVWMHEVSIDQEKVKQAKFYQVYIWKGIAWTINISWMLFLLSEPGCGRWVDQVCQPIYSNAAFHNVTLLDIIGITFQLTLFFMLISYFRLGIIHEKRR